jgi:flagellar capping protein FliD
MDNLDKKVNEFIEKQMEINQQNIFNIEKLNKELNENPRQNGYISQNNENGENIYRNTNNKYEKKINELENKIKKLNEAGEKLDRIKDENQNEIKNNFEQINNMMSSLNQNINEILVKLKSYIDIKFEKLKQSNISNNNQ